MDNNDLKNDKIFQLVAAVVCTVNAAPFIGSSINGSFANILTIMVLVISVMILLRQAQAELTKMPCVLAIISAALQVGAYVIGQAEQYTLISFISDYTFPIDITTEIMLTESQLSALPLVLTLGAVSVISWVFMAVAAALFFINHNFLKKAAA